MTTIDQRDYQVLQLVGRFKQLTAVHIHELLFADARTRKPCYRSLDRLYNRHFLHRLEHRLIGGAKGGSGQYVFVLSSDGYRLLYREAARPIRAINYHTLEIANTYLALVRLERAGTFQIEDYATEPDCWLRVGSYELKPDLYLEVKQTSGLVVKSFIEVDLGTEGERQLRGKLAAYMHAFNNADAEQYPIWPRTLWVVIDAARAAQLMRIISTLPADEQRLFKVCVAANLAELFA